ncbi:MAG TPA: hypothetical protein VGP44_03635, partial [Gemmatimonadales bacterium]|nr:hypothetical protein [Gemmatimonadales bacterium]
LPSPAVQKHDDWSRGSSASGPIHIEALLRARAVRHIAHKLEVIPYENRFKDVARRACSGSSQHQREQC